jgi:gamma-D-glutamyl-L-lysine dipeptidyl-peptidase
LDTFAVMFGICYLSTIPVRSIPSDTAEMVTQVILGELFEILETRGSWELIRISYDGYEGWIDSKQYLPLQPLEFESILQQPIALCADLLNISTCENGEKLVVPFGSNLPFYTGESFRIGDKTYSFAGETMLITEESQVQKLPETALKLLNVPYMWGGRSPLGMDCSGFVQLVYKLHGIFLPRDAQQQATVGQAIDFLNEAMPGDLAFFDNEDGRIVHVGILLASDMVIHASGQVRTDFIDHHGIYNPVLGRYSHKLRLIKRILP